MYYLRTRPKADAIQFTVDQQQLSKTTAEGAPAASSKVVAKTVTDLASGPVSGLEYAAEVACESCSA